jgi:3-oxoacyl-[acyl-carrier protein] reductase
LNVYIIQNLFSFKKITFAQMLAIVTGASRGIGRSICFALAAEGYDLVVCARTIDGLNQLKLDIGKKLPNTHFDLFTVDFNDIEQVKIFAEKVNQKFSKIDLLVNNAGIFIPGLFSEEKDAFIEMHWNVNFKSAWYLTKLLVGKMKLEKAGHIFNICSVTSISPRYDAASYSVSKMALYGFSKVLAEELREFNIKVTAILPASVNTSSWDGINAPRHEFIQPEDVANALIAALRNSSGAYTEEIILKTLNKKL